MEANPQPSPISMYMIYSMYMISFHKSPMYVYDLLCI